MNTQGEYSFIKGSFIERVAAFLIDQVIIFIPLVFIFYIIGKIFPGIKSIDSELSGLFYFIYNIVLLQKRGATVGKKILHLKVVNTSYDKLSLGRIILRETIGRIISGIFGLSYIWAIIDRRRQTWHAKMARTLVVKVDQHGLPIPGEDPPITKSAWFLFISLAIFAVIPFILAFFVLFYLFVGQSNQVRGGSMLPNYNDGEYFLTDKISYRLVSPKRGDVIVFRVPHNLNIDSFKRIIGLPGEEVMIRDGKVYINSEVLEEDYLPANSFTSIYYGGFMQEGVPVTVAHDSYFVLGDNRAMSSDSREYGLVSNRYIIGKLWFRYY